MKIKFWGAAGEVTGSCHLLEINGRRVALDAGLCQGRRRECEDKNRTFPCPPKDVHALVLSHAHLDHTGNLPTWVRNGFRGNIYATPATRDLCALMLMDSAHIQQTDIERVNRARRRDGQPPVEPLYDQEDALQALKQIVSFNYGQEFEPLPGVKMKYVDAGHMLGSAMVLADIPVAGGKTRRLVFSGDIGHPGSPLLERPSVPDGADWLIMESTYGDREHPPGQVAVNELLEVVKATAQRGGKLIVPAFAVGRTQEVVYHLDRLCEAGKLPPIDVFVDSPLAVNVTETFRQHPECYNAEVRRNIQEEADRNVFGFRRLQYVLNVEESKRLNFHAGPAVIISASGMCEAGRILHHLRNNLGDPRNTVLFVGYQGEHTLGRKLLDGLTPVKIFGEEVKVKANMVRVEAFSGHADRSELLDWAKGVAAGRGTPKTFLVHGEDGPRAGLTAGLKAQGFADVHSPGRGEEFALD